MFHFPRSILRMHWMYTYYIHIEFIWDSFLIIFVCSTFPSNGMIWVQLLRRDLPCFLRSTPRIAFLQVVPLKYFKHQPNVRKYPNPNWYHIELIQQWQVWSSCNVLCILGTWSPADLCNMKSKKSLQGMNDGSSGLCVLKWTVSSEFLWFQVSRISRNTHHWSSHADINLSLRYHFATIAIGSQNDEVSAIQSGKTYQF